MVGARRHPLCSPIAYPVPFKTLPAATPSQAAAAAADAWRRQQEQQQQNQMQQQALLPPAPHTMTSEQQQVHPAPYPVVAPGANGQPLYAAPPMANGTPQGEPNHTPKQLWYCNARSFVGR